MLTLPAHVHVRTIAADELEAVRDLAMQIWTRHHHATIAPSDMDQTVSRLFDIDRMEEEMTRRGHAHFVVRAGRTDVGFASAFLDGTRLFVPHLYVMKDFRGFGLGKALVRAAQDHFDPARDMVILVHKDDGASTAFCLRNGFAVSREIRSEIGGYAFTDLVMHKYVNPNHRVSAA